MASGTKKKDAVLLWTNSSPTSTFSTQTVALGLSKYAYVCVVARYSDETSRLISFMAPVNGVDFSMCSIGNVGYNNMTIASRMFTPSSTGIEFYSSYYRQTTSTSGASASGKYLIPVYIYGIRG